MSSCGANTASDLRVERLRAHALSLPETVEDFPWGESAFKVRKKVFVFLNRRDDGGFSMSVKLPISSEMALTLPFTAPTGYGLGRSGWVSCIFIKDDEPPIEMLFEWIEQSYLAVAPKKLTASWANPSA